MPAPIIIIRGAPGAGKSTFAQKLRDSIFHNCNRITAIFETDNFFVDSINHRDYHFNTQLLSIAHAWNQGEVIRCCRDCPDVPVIFVTAKEDDTLKETCLREGAKAYVTKPFSPSALLRTLQDVLHD